MKIARAELKRNYNVNERWFLWLNNDPAWDRVRKNKRFKKFKKPAGEVAKRANGSARRSHCNHDGNALPWKNRLVKRSVTVRTVLTVRFPAAAGFSVNAATEGTCH